MSGIAAKKRRGLAEPRLGWSGVAALTAAQLSASDLDLRILLPGHHSANGEIIPALRDLGRRYHRYLHQDEFGPTRAERMAALRSLRDQLDLLLSRLNGLPAYLRVQLSKQLACTHRPVEGDTDLFHAHCNDEEAVQQVGEAAADGARTLHAPAATRDAELLADLRDSAERTVELLSALDTTTAGAVAIDAELPRLELAEIDEDDLIGFVVASARIERLRHRVEQTLASLEHQGGPERLKSLRWLVRELCDLYHRETGQPVTSSAVAKNRYTSRPQSPAGRFVLAAVKALQPTDTWAQEPDHKVARRRDHILHNGTVERAVHLAMREYVAAHSSSTSPRGRWKRAKKPVE
jgi:hypothetical protein